MRFRLKRQNNHLSGANTGFQPVLGLFNHIATLDCSVNLHRHNFNIVSCHPLQTITRIINLRLKFAFSKIVEAVYDIKVEQKTTFVPEALLTGNYSIIHDYKKAVQNSRVDSYIKLHLKHESKSYERKKLASSEPRNSNILGLNYSTTKIVQAKVFTETRINVKSTKNKIKCHDEKNAENSKSLQSKINQTTFTANDPCLIRVTQVSHQKPFSNEENVDINIKNCNILEQHYHHKIHNINQARIDYTKKSKLMKKPSIDAIKINYIAIKDSHEENPEASTFIYKTNKSHRAKKILIENKTQFHNPRAPQFHSQTFLHDLSFSVNNEQQDKFSVYSNILRKNHNFAEEKHFEVDNLSQNYQKSLKNSQIHQPTSDQLYQSKNYVLTEKKKLKKGRKSVYIDNFQNYEIL